MEFDGCNIDNKVISNAIHIPLCSIDLETSYSYVKVESRRSDSIWSSSYRKAIVETPPQELAG